MINFNFFFHEKFSSTDVFDDTILNKFILWYIVVNLNVFLIDLLTDWLFDLLLR